jgi:hypothetical protein
VSRSLAERASAALAAHTSRRGFLARSAVVGSALTVAPSSYILRPGTAYASICSCSGSSCDCASTCCDGYTEFCCTLNGANSCPPGTAPGGWWKADGSGLCTLSGVAQPRYYIDCNVLPGQSPCSCGCALGSCSHRKACCTVFRYGQCHQEVPGVRAIMCRVITCVPPWEFDPTCTTTSATDNNTRFHDAPCLHIPVHQGLPAFTRGDHWRLRKGLAAGGQVRFSWPLDGGIPVIGDWDGDGIATPGVYHGGTWYLRNSNTPGPPEIVFDFGWAEALPVVGDWNGDGRQTIGVYHAGDWYLRNSNDAGNPDYNFTFGWDAALPVIGDWNGDGRQTIGVYYAGDWYLRNTNNAGNPDFNFNYGWDAATPVVGDWNGNGSQTVGVWYQGWWLLRNTNASGNPDIVFEYGRTGDIPLVWTQP